MTSGVTEPRTDDFDVTLPLNPYPGLRPFEKHEWPIFFGRETMTDEVVGRLVREQFLVVHGDSGCGKSSLLRAGVLARLEQESARGGLTWRTCAMQPRDAPLQHLAEALVALDGSQDAERIIEIRRAVGFGSDAPRALARLLRRSDTDHLCILVDQFEELFAFAKRHGPDEARLLVQLLVGLLEQPPPGLYAVVTMRSEFLGVCAQFPGLPEAVNRSQYLLPRMAHADMARAIREPATLYGGYVSAALAERLIADARGRQDQLPLVQHGLMALHRQKVSHERAAPAAAAAGPAEQASVDGFPGRGWRLELADYSAPGGLSQLLSDHADELCPLADPGRTRVVERLFRALTDINAEGQAVRRPQILAELIAVTGSDLPTLQGIVDPFRAEGASFLTPYERDPIGQATLLDISHEALIRCWRRLSDPKDGWLVREFQDGLVWRSLLVQADSFDRNPSNLLSPATAEERAVWLADHNASWAERYGGGWDRVARLVGASVAAGRAEKAAEQVRAEQEIERLVENNRRQRITTLAVAAFALIVVVLGGLAVWKGRQAAAERNAANTERLKAEAQTRRADEQSRVADERLQKMSLILDAIPDQALRESLARQFMPGEVKSLTVTEETRLAAELRSPRDGDRAQARKPAQDGLNLWANGATLHVRFIGGSAEQRARVERLAQEWTKSANLKFRFDSTRSDADIRVAFAPNQGSWSYLGTDALGVPADDPTMNLGFSSEEGSVLHEFGHVLGLIHEHLSPNAKLPWNKAKVYQDLGGPPNNWTRLAVDQNMFEQSTTIRYREFDASSIMMYLYPAAWFSDGRPRGGAQELSESDKQFVAKLYPFEVAAD